MAVLCLASTFALAACGQSATPDDGTGSSGTSSGGSTSGTGGAPTGGIAGSPASGGSGASSGMGSGGATTVGGASATGGAGAAGAAGTYGGAGGGPGDGGTSGAGASGGSGNAGGGTGGTSASGGKAGTGGAGGASGAGSSGAAGAAGGPSLPPITDYKSMGPFATTVDRNQGPNQGYTIYRPQTLGQNGFLHAPIVFGPGIGQAVTVHATMLTNFASHGFVVVGCPVLSGRPGDAQNRATMLNGLTWIVAQNTQSGIYQGKLYADHAVSMGFSVGGTSAVEIGGHEAVATVVSIHGHRATAALHGPMLQTTGTGDTVGMPLQQATYDMSQVQTFLATLTGAPHTYIEMNGGGEERPAILAWMRYWIYGDAGARNFFYGTDCVLCRSPWQNPQRKNWP